MLTVLSSEIRFFAKPQTVVGKLFDKKLDMNRRILLIIVLGFVGLVSFGQKFDSTIYLHLLKSDKTEFISYAKSVNMTIDFDSTSNTLFAKTKGILFSKPLKEEGNNYYSLSLIVSTLDKENNKTILKNANPVEGKKNTWIDNSYLYVEWDTENPYSKEMWYKVLIYSKK